MILQYDIEKLNALLEDFYLATGVNINLFNENFEPVRVNNFPLPDYCRAIQTRNMDRRPCKNSDVSLLKQCREKKKMVMHCCHAGLRDIAVPILYEDVILGYLIFGQFKTEMDFSRIQEKIANLHVNMQEMERYYDELRCMDDEKIRSVTSIAEIIVRYIMTENMLKPYLFSKIERVTEYIHQHLHENITIKQLCEETHLSTSVLYKKFHSHFGCTVNDYINTKRVEESLRLLEKTELSIEEIAERVGFSSASYFSRIFKQKMRMPPMRFRTSTAE